MTTAKSERTHICLFGRTNVGKSSILNLIAKQDVSIVSEIAGTTTDVVEKVMELAPIGAVVIVDTAGIDDTSELGSERKRKTELIYRKCDFAVLIVEPNKWTEYEENVIVQLNHFDIKFAILINKIDLQQPSIEFIGKMHSIANGYVMQISATTTVSTDLINQLTTTISKLLPDLADDTNMLAGLIAPNDTVLFVTPIDTGAPKGRMILPQVQALRAVLDINAIAIFVQVAEYQQTLRLLHTPPKIVVTDSQVINEVVELSPPEQLLTTFSILLARLKGDFAVEARSAYILKDIKKDAKILIAEACSHHQQKDDIAKVKFPKLLEKYCGFMPQIDYCNGRDFPANIADYNLIIHCGACMLTRTEKLNRVRIATDAGVPLTNFGMALSFLNGHYDRVLEPFTNELE
ncbi:MAG: [FeFe] hydrogenase H-cluster maturation GTPase HydF [Ignavibacteria bacterium]|jgi:[FeFe] hydrogenase H-cluster maturation GTPase HydF|nr:[FeFe] hydrogenase H-cluster maturation GTPase HydF [Ignavibacteria bacterium]